MSLNKLFDQFLGSNANAVDNIKSGASGLAQNIGSKLPGGLAGGAAAGGLAALLVSNKTARKYAGKAAGYGGAALLGGLAFKAYSNWKQQADADTNPSGSNSERDFHQHAMQTDSSGTSFEMTLIRAMIAAARADGNIDAEEQKRIFSSVDRMGLSSEEKGFVFDCLTQDITIDQLAGEVHNIEQKAEVYLASCMVIDPDHPAELAWLQALAQALQLPPDLCRQLEDQASMAYAEAA